MKKNTQRVLIVDDLPANRMILSSLLAAKCIPSDLAESGPECLELCERNDYDLILLDHRMPEMDGVDTFVQLKEIFKKKERDVPVICHTTEDARDFINLYKAAGFSDVLIKPLSPAKDLEVIMSYLRKKALEDAMMDDLFDDMFNSDTGDQTKYDGIDYEEELDKLPFWLKSVPLIDLREGIENCGGAEDYLEALFMFRSSIGKKSAELKNSFESGDHEGYRLSVHSLKSMAGLLGMLRLREDAAMLEKAAIDGDHDRIARETESLIEEYRRFSDQLSPLKEEDLPVMDTAGMMQREDEEIPEEVDRSDTVLFIRQNDNIISKGIENNLKQAGFEVLPVSDEPHMVINHRYDADIRIYYLYPGDPSQHEIMVNLLGEMCQDDSRLLCLVGDDPDIRAVMHSRWAHRVTRTYVRPVNIEKFTLDMEYFKDLLSEYHKHKRVFLVDDDSDYLALINGWLSDHYAVTCFHNGDELLSGLGTVEPDLILMDYEMPGMDGYTLLKILKNKPETAGIPIIFLTGKNERHNVFRVLEFKPDGYLLKSSSRDFLIDAVRRLFSERLFRDAAMEPEVKEED